MVYKKTSHSVGASHSSLLLSRRIDFFLVFLYFLLLQTYVSVARYFLPDREQRLSVCTFLHVFRLVSQRALLGAENCITVLAEKGLKADCFLDAKW